MKRMTKVKVTMISTNLMISISESITTSMEKILPTRLRVI